MKEEEDVRYTFKYLLNISRITTTTATYNNNLYYTYNQRKFSKFIT